MNGKSGLYGIIILFLQLVDVVSALKLRASMLPPPPPSTSSLVSKTTSAVKPSLSDVGDDFLEKLMSQLGDTPTRLKLASTSRTMNGL